MESPSSAGTMDSEAEDEDEAAGGETLVMYEGARTPSQVENLVPRSNSWFVEKWERMEKLLLSQKRVLGN